MTDRSQIKVLLADDHAVVREGLAAIIERRSDLSVVAQAVDGRDAVEMYERHKPDVCLIDLKMPVMDGVAAISSIRSIDPKARIIVLTTFDGDEDIYRGLKAGAKGYLLKDISPERLAKAIRAVHAGGRAVPAEIAQKLAERFPNEELSERERDVLTLLVAGMSNLEIGVDLSISESTVKFHVHHILAKLGATDRTQAVIVALKRGLAHL